MKITTETLSKEVVSLLIRGREVVDDQVQVDDDKVMKKINDSWVLITAKVPKKVGVTTKAKLTVAERVVAVTNFLVANPGSKYTNRELAEHIPNVNNDQITNATSSMAAANAVQRQKRKNAGPHGVDVWEYYL